MKRRQSFAIALWLTATLSPALAQPARQPDALAITGVTIIDVAASSVGDALQTNRTVIVTGNRITELATPQVPACPRLSIALTVAASSSFPDFGTCTHT